MTIEPTLSRRKLLARALAGAACPICTAAFGQALADGSAHWGYEGESGPEHGGGLSTDFKVCALEVERTPIDIKGATRAELANARPSMPVDQRFLLESL